jgi:1,4-alpha-glucan branching enzyme
MPGRKLTFMGNELAAPTEWNFREQLPWWLLEDPAHRGVQRLVADLNALVRNESAMHAHDFDPAGFRWIDCHDSQNSVLSFMRFDGERFVVCLFNFTPIVRRGYRVGVPVPCRYRELVNSDSTHYGGSNVGNSGTLAADNQPWMGQTASVLVTLPPLAAVFLAPDTAPDSNA